MSDDENEDFKKQLFFEAAERAAKPAGSDPYTYVDESDGTQYEWNHDRQAWFPKVSEDFLAAYQANYGNYQSDKTENKTPGTSQIDIDKPTKTDSLKPGEKRKPSEPNWFEVDDAHNTNVYVSGLPLDTTEPEYIEIMSKCGLIMKDPNTNQMKIKMYRNPDGSFKGDALCCYIKVESVDLALSIIDGSRIKDKTLHVERAKFQLKGAYDPTKKPKRKAKEKEKIKKKMAKLFDWRPDKLRGQRDKWEKTVIIKNMFDPSEFEKDAPLILEYQKDVREECGKCGEVKKVVVYDRNPEGVVGVSFKEPEEADQCVQLMNRRWFAGRQLTAETWDGRTRYKVEETEEELEKRLKQWDEFLEEDKTGVGTANNNSGNDKGAELTDEEKHSGEDSGGEFDEKKLS